MRQQQIRKAPGRRKHSAESAPLPSVPAAADTTEADDLLHRIDCVLEVV